MQNFPDIDAAKAFAHKWHDFIGQVRKYTNEPYWVHTDEVESIVALVPWDDNLPTRIHKNMCCASHGHDLDEDVLTWLKIHKPEMVAVFEAEYKETFTLESQEMIVGLTDVYVREDYPKLNRATRKNLERERIAKLSSFVKTIKVADLISNTRSIVEHDKDFARIYIKEKIALLPLLSEAAPSLLRTANMQVVAAAATLGLTTKLI